eukprot:3158424-Alexandrium_andersonii.AAC.1
MPLCAGTRGAALTCRRTPQEVPAQPGTTSLAMRRARQRATIRATSLRWPSSHGGGGATFFRSSSLR